MSTSRQNLTPPLRFSHYIPRKGVRMVTVISGQIWSPALRLWFVWTESPAWAEPRPWHVADLPAEVSAKLNNLHR